MSEEHNSCNFFYIQSADRLTGSTSATNFIVNNQTFSNSSSFEIALIQIPYTFYPIDSAHIALTFTPNGGVDATATIAPGSYTVAQFQTALAAALQAAGDGSTYTVSISSITGKITITQNVGTFVIRGSVSTSTMLPIIGFAAVDTAAAIAQTGTLLVNLGGTDYLDIMSTELTKHDTRSLDTSYGGARRVIRVPIKNYVFGQTIEYRPLFHHMNHKPESGNSIDIQLYDMYGNNIADLGGRDWYFKSKYHTDKGHRKTIRHGDRMDYFSASTLASKS